MQLALLLGHGCKETSTTEVPDFQGTPGALCTPVVAVGQDAPLLLCGEGEECAILCKYSLNELLFYAVVHNCMRTEDVTHAGHLQQLLARL